MTHLYSWRKLAHLTSEHVHWLGDANAASSDFPGTALLIKVCITTSLIHW